MTAATVTSADSPLTPPARYSACSPSGSFCFTSDPSEGTWIHTRDEPGEPLWRLPGWYRVAFVSDDGEHFVTGFHGVNLVPISDPEQAVVVQFWRRGRLLRSYTLEALGYRRESLQRTVSHYAWGTYAGFDSRKRFRLTMIDGVDLLFEVNSGELARRLDQSE